MQEMGIIDVWRDLHPGGCDYTHFSHPQSVYSRIHYFLTFNTERPRITTCDIGNIDISDHGPLYLNINLSQKPPKNIMEI